ncbi:Protein brambleberry [Armadillidium vulgare]|nr:Protein brambleberry [Armadillidium vulgare]
MIRSTILIFALILTIFNPLCCYGGIFKWLFKGYDDKLQDKTSPLLESKPNVEKNIYSAQICLFYVNYKRYFYFLDTSISSVPVPFEWKSMDEDFINEVSKFTTKMSDLDICHHQVVLHLRKSCADLTEEEISKVAVNLLNCQSTVEKRRIYPCTDDMSLSDCTSEMDQDTWNAYHIISNRVRAVCYHFRQQQFTAKTEMTVNKLVHSTEEQIDAMKLLEVSQSNLKDVTSETLESLKSGHMILEKQQEELSSAQVERNFDIAEDAQQQLQYQGEGQRNTHQKILKDLSDIQDSASRVWGQIDESTKAILHNHEQTVAQYSRLMNDLQKMNSTVHHLMDILLKMRVKIEEKFSWISSLVGDTDTTVQKIYSFVLHICYCLLGMIAASFLQVPYATKMALIIIVPLNAIAELNFDSSLTFSTLTVVLAICVFLWESKSNIPSLQKLEISSCEEYEGDDTCENRYEVKTPSRQYNSSSEDDEDTKEELNLSYSSKSAKEIPYKSSPLPTIIEDKFKRFDQQINGRRETSATESDYISNSLNIQSPASMSSVRRRLIPDLNTSPVISRVHSASLTEPLSPFNSSSPVTKNSRESTPLRSFSQSFTSKKTCIAICKSGLFCRNLAQSGNSFCHKHINGSSRESTPLR